MKIKQMSPQLLVADLERSLDFYTRVLGFAIDFRYKDFYAGVSKDGHSIHLKCGIPRPANGEDLDLVFSVEAIDECFETLRDRVTVIQPLRDMPYGREFYISDPDGYVISFME